ncbi:MAG: hypothetical protein AAB354_16205 [candidate division KSB1 bacterium]
MALAKSDRNISAGESLRVSALFVGLMAVAILLAEKTDRVLFYKILYTARTTMILFTPAMCLYILPGASRKKENYWRWFWTLSFLSYAIHLYYSFFIFFHGSLHEFFADQGAFVATINLIITIWWLFDMLMVWFHPAPARWIHVQRTGIQVFLAGTFFMSTVVLHAVDDKEPFVIVWGVVQAAAILICWLIRVRTFRTEQKTKEVFK